MSLVTNLAIGKYKTSKDAERILRRLSDTSGWQDHVLARLAMARSLREPGKPSKVVPDRKGKEFNGSTLFGAKEDGDAIPWFAAVIAEHAGGGYQNEDEPEELVSAHLHRGLTLLDEELTTAGGLTPWLLALARSAAELAAEAEVVGGDPMTTPSGSVVPLTVPIGRVRPDTEPIMVTLNDTRKYSNCHIAVSGMSGSGKTQLAMQILASAAKVAVEPMGILFIDFAKGDVAGNASFVESIDAKVIKLPGGILPIGAFHLADYADTTVRLAAEEKREVYSHLFSSLGAKQQGRLVEALREAYAVVRDDREPAPDFPLVAEQLKLIYEAEGLQPDSLTELFRRLTAYSLFWSRASGDAVVKPLHTQRWLIDLHELSGLKEITAFTLIEQLYREMRSLPDSYVDPANGCRQIRCILAIDESQYYLRAKNRFLQGIIREGRSKGFMVMLMCQSPDDFDQSDFDYTEQLQFTYMLQCKTEAKAVGRLLGIGREEAKRLATELGRMEPLNGVGRATGNASALSKFRIVPFYEMTR